MAEDASDGKAGLPPMSYVDDKSALCIPFIKKYTKAGVKEYPTVVIGINGVQGAGKTTLVKGLAHALKTEEHLETLVLSIDDFYLTHDDQQKLARDNSLNSMLQHRGVPGTHDCKMLCDCLEDIIVQRQVTKIPRYDKSAYNGEGDRTPESTWEEVNQPHRPIQVIILEGWCVGFTPDDSDRIIAQYVASKDLPEGSSVLRKHRLEDLLYINERLRGYDDVTRWFSAMIHIDAQDTHYVYDWRLEQEAALRRDKGKGMTNEQVVKFVDGYYPSYELYTEGLRRGAWKLAKKRAIALVESAQDSSKMTVTQILSYADYWSRVRSSLGHEGDEKQLGLIVGKDRKVISTQYS